MKKDSKTTKIKRAEQSIDAKDLVLGRLATQCATWLQGKHKPEFVPYHDLGDFVKVTNVDKVKLTGRKLEQKKYHRFTGYVGNLKTKPLSELLEKDPKALLRRVVYGMLPANKLRNERLKRLKMFTSEEEPSKETK